MKKKGNKIGSLYIYISLFLIGVVVGCFLHVFLYRSFSISDEVTIQVDPVNFISSLGIFGLGLYIANVFSKKNEQDRTEKDLIIGDLKQYKSNLRNEITVLVEPNEILYLYAVSKLKTLRVGFNSISDLISKCGSGQEELIAILGGRIRDLKDIFTDSAEVKNENIQLTDLNKEEIETIVHEIEVKTTELIVDINRS
jgi:hypothetical protein